jgi:hypothetical protein
MPELIVNWTKQMPLPLKTTVGFDKVDEDILGDPPPENDQVYVVAGGAAGKLPL